MNNIAKIIHINPKLNDDKKTHSVLMTLVENLSDIDKKLEKHLGNDRNKK